MAPRIASVITALALFALGAEAQEIGQPQRGLEKAQQLCAQCHAVTKSRARSPNPNAPPFETIAAIPGMTTAALYSVLQSSHKTMPNILLDQPDMTHIVAYILSLRPGR
jgi:mono/diheme cytochrome c family protein